MMNGLDIYNSIGAFSEVLGASGHRQIQMLFANLLTRIDQASLAIDNNNIVKKCSSISAANDIVIYLRECLNFSVDKTLATRLDRIYAHLEKQLFAANASNSKPSLDNCREIINNLKTWWDKLND